RVEDFLVCHLRLPTMCAPAHSVTRRRAWMLGDAGAVMSRGSIDSDADARLASAQPPDRGGAQFNTREGHVHRPLQRAFLRPGGIFAGVALAAVASAQTPYPNRPIRIVVPYTAGTGIDVLARVIGQKLSDRLKVAVVVENRPGASGNIGTEAVAKAAPDGYT